MAWGFGRVGYGPYRVGQMLEGAPHAKSTLQRAATLLASGNAVGAYRVFGDRGVAALHGLGLAFGTKYLYFCSPAGGSGALILDRLAAVWLAKHAGVRLNQVRWSSRTYAKYLSMMFGWADELKITGDAIESVIFQHQAKLAGGQWG